MKRFFTLAFVFTAITGGAFAQGSLDAFNLSYNDLKGTARSVSMGGAFGALGGDVSGIAINPAGIGVYTKSEVVTTLNFTNTTSKSNLLGSSLDQKKTKFNFDNLAFVGTVPIESDVVPLINFGFSYNNLKSFNRKYRAGANGLNKSYTQYASDRANSQKDFDYITYNKDGKDGYDYGADWTSVLAYHSGLIAPNNSAKNFSPAFRQFTNNETVDSELSIQEKGSISSYDFNVGTTIDDIFSIGVTLALTDIDYHLSSTLYEKFSSNKENYYLDNELKTEGTGWQIKTGLIFKPIKELRIGAAYHSPTWYNMTDRYYGAVDASWNLDNNDKYVVYGTPGFLEGGEANDYKFKTPDKWVFSLAGIIGQYAIISADYELTNYSKMNLSNRYSGDYNFDRENDLTSQYFKNSSTIRVGAEIRFTPQFSGRLGYMWQQSPFDKKLKADQGTNKITPETGGTVPQYTIVGDANHFTWGLGYKFTPNFYTDIAFMIKNRKDDLYMYQDSDKAELKTNQFSGLITFGCRF